MKKPYTKGWLCSVLLLTFIAYPFNLYSQNFKVNYDENKIAPYILPDPLKMENGKVVKTDYAWWKQRRPEILSLFEKNVYGKTPSKKLPLSFKVLSVDQKALNGKATRKEVVVYFTANKKGPSMTLLIYLPNRSKPSPVFLSMNFNGNHTITSDNSISITQSWVPNNKVNNITDNKANPGTRGIDSASWPLKQIIERGYGIVTFYYGDIAPDNKECLQNQIFSLFRTSSEVNRKPDEWGGLGIWAWGLSRAMDYICTDRQIDPKKVIVLGHSRLGKAAVWAGAQDRRFAIVVSNNSGCGGAALSMRAIGETVKIINTNFPYWFCENFRKYNDNEAALPVDQHELIALIAPRPVYIASAEDDKWSDPKGEFLSGVYASPVYKLLHTNGLSIAAMPPVNQPVMNTIAYHIRTGGHAITLYDWERYMDFADMNFKKQK
ncbi:MAG: acetylxylan esterase [Bacteroidota bacterium]|nr:acetylxylan esterase [Bacteroidota bacterium]